MNAVTKMVALALLFIVCDLPWLIFVSTWSQSMVKKIQGSPMQFRMEAAPPVYLALAYLIQQTRSNTEAFFTGLAVYAVYDFTNYATLTNYDLMFGISDSIWGGVLFTIVRNVALALNIL